MNRSVDFDIKNIIDISELQEFVEGIELALEVPVAFLDASGKVLASVTNWNLCSGFPLQQLVVKEAGRPVGRQLSSLLVDGNSLLEKSCFELSCQGGCSAVFIPIMVGGRQLGTFFMGQFRHQNFSPELQAGISLSDDAHQCIGGQENSPTLSRRSILEVMNLASRHVCFLTRMANQQIANAKKQAVMEKLNRKFHSLFDHTPDPLYVVDCFGKLIEANRSACKKLGLTHSRLLQMRLEDILLASEMGRIHEQMACIRRDGSAVFETICAHGLAIEVNCRFIEFDGKSAILAQVKDIEARKQSDNVLRKSEERFRSVFEQSNVAMTIVSPKGKFLQVNQRFCDFIGYSEEEILQFSAWDISVPEDREEVRQTFGSYLEGEEKTLQLERRYRRKDGSMCWGSVSASMIYGRNRRPFYSIGIIEDITQQKKAEAAIHHALVETEAAKDRISAIVGSIKDGLIATDIEDRIILMNEAAEQLLGIRFKEAQSKFLERLVDRVMPGKKLVPCQEARTREFMLEKKAATLSDRTLCTIKFKLSPIVAKDGEKIGRIAVLRDITREREIDLMKNEFISTAAHELRTPLTSVKGFSQVLLSENDFNDDQRKEFLSYIYENSEVLEKIVNDLLDLSRVESGQIIQLKKKESNIGTFLDRIVLQYQKEHRCHNFETVRSKQVLPLWFDREKIFQVMENLLSNAVKFSPEKSSIRIGCKMNGTEAVISVSDEGSGMSPKEVERIFDKFYRVDSSDTAVAGLGLGMAIVKNIIEAHLGRIWVESLPGSGTTVSFTLPLTHCLQKS